jgi:hypothetical protein
MSQHSDESCSPTSHVEASYDQDPQSWMLETNIQKIHPELFTHMAPGPLDDFFKYTGKIIYEHDNHHYGPSRRIETFKDGELVEMHFQSYQLEKEQECST